MAQPADFYREQAANCGSAADAATLANERDKFRQAQVAWQALADATTKIRDAAAQRDAERKA